MSAHEDFERRLSTFVLHSQAFLFLSFARVAQSEG
jgi:hypothetical protein